MIFNRFLSVLILFMVLISCTTPQAPLAVAAPEKQVVELSDMFQTGHTRFQEVIQQDSVMEAVWMENSPRVVMLLIDIEFDDGEKEQIQQSGILVGEDQLVLTAGHGFIVDDGKIISIRVIGGTNKEVPVNLLELRYDKGSKPVVDWAILKPLYFMKMLSAPIQTGSYSYSDQVLILGFPGSLGLSSKGFVERVSENMIDPKVPLGILCDHPRFDPKNVMPIAGSIPVRGISGAPVFNRQGELIGLFSSMGRRRTVGGSDYIFGIADIPWKVIQELSGN